MNFGEALVAVKAGKKIRREGWNGKGMWVAYTPRSVIGAFAAPVDGPLHVAAHVRGAAHCLAVELLHNNTASDGTIRIGGHLDMKAADGSLVIGWLASQTDMLADDWEIAP